MHIWPDRELILDLLEKMTGNRIHYSFITIGGTRRDINEGTKNMIKRSLRKLRKRFETRAEIFRTDKTVNERLERIGILRKSEAKKLGVVGPVARASGLRMDTRKDVPYNVYSEFEFKQSYCRTNSGKLWPEKKIRGDHFKIRSNWW